jgi:predicted site-specific integrase-resolvase
MKLSAWAKQNGLTYKTAWRMFTNKTLPIPAEQYATGTIIVHPTELSDIKAGKTVIYARVSSRAQKDDLERQLQRLRSYAAEKGIIVHDEIIEIASGLNDHRPKLHKILTNPEVKTIMVEHRDRLARFGTRTIEATLKSNKRRLIVVNETEDKHDLIQDFVDVVTSMCAKLYGKRSAKNRANRALKAAEVNE